MITIIESDIKHLYEWCRVNIKPNTPKQILDKSSDPISKIINDINFDKEVEEVYIQTFNKFGRQIYVQEENYIALNLNEYDFYDLEENEQIIKKGNKLEKNTLYIVSNGKKLKTCNPVEKLKSEEIKYNKKIKHIDKIRNEQKIKIDSKRFIKLNSYHRIFVIFKLGEKKHPKPEKKYIKKEENEIHVNDDLELFLDAFSDNH